MSTLSVSPPAPLEPVTPCLPVAPYIGGKKLLSKRIIARIDAIPHSAYAEVFVGMGGVFLRRTARPKVEVINDWSEDVATFFRVLQRHYLAFLDMIRWQVASRAGFERLAAQDPATLTDLERSARFLYLQRVAFGGKVAGRSFGAVPSGPSRFDLTKLVPMLEAVHERLTPVVIERRRWQDFITQYDRPGTLFYLDPPYFGTEHFYGRDLFGRDEFTEMAVKLAKLRGRFILSINDHPEIRALFAAFDIEAVPVRYTAGGMQKSIMAGELIISN